VTIKFHLKKTTGENVYKDIKCYVKSPLKNSTVSGGFDLLHPQTFKTGSVTDPDVKYQWEFNDITTPFNFFKAETTGLFFTKNFESGNGTVSITDGKHTSPIDTFHYSFEDSTPPVLKFLDKEKQNEDTLFCRGEWFYKKIQITDLGCGIVQDVKINGHSEVEKENFTKKFLSNIGVISIYLRDGSKNHNDTTLKYYVKIDSGKVASDANLNFEILPIEDSITVNAPVYNGFTHVEYLDLRSLNHQLNIFANGKIQGSIEVAGVQYSYKPFKVDLSAGWNSVMVELIDKELGKAIDTTSVSVLYDESYKIDKKPTIFNVRFTNARLANGFLVVNNDSLDLKVIAYDDKGMVKAVVVQPRDTLICENNENQWSGRIPVPLKTLQIRAIDSAEQVTDTVFNVVNNNRPSFVNIRHKVQIVAGTVYQDILSAVDIDGNKLKYSIIDSLGKNIKINQTTGEISWVTSQADINEAGFVFQFAVSDNFDIVIDSVRVIVHKSSSDTIPPVQFLTTPADIPSDVESGLSYAYKLQFVSRPDSVIYSMKTDLRSIKIQNDTLMVKPQPMDTGYHRVTLVATNLMDESDTLYLEYNVHPANRKPVIKADSSLYKTGALAIKVAGSIDSGMAFTLWIDDPDIVDKNRLKTGIKSRFSDAKIQLLSGLDNHYELKLFNSKAVDVKDTLLIFCEDHGGLVDTLKIPVLYTSKVYSVEPLYPSDGENIKSDTVIFKWNKCKGNDVTYLVQAGQSQDSVFKTVIIKDTSLMQVIRKSDTYRWRIITASGRDSAYGQWQYFSLHSSTHIQFSTIASQIKSFCFADIDTYSLKLKIKAGTGGAVRTFKASLRGKAIPIDLVVTNNEILKWIPTVNDTGTYLLNIEVLDDIGNADTLQTILTVVPASGCHITIRCSDTALYCDKTVDLYGEDRETNLIITVDRSRKSIFDTFNINVASHSYAVNVNADSAVLVLQRPLRNIADDTLSVTARNKSNNISSGIEKIAVRYNVPKKKVTIGASGSLVLSDGLSKIPVLIRLDQKCIGFTKKSGFRFLVNNKTDTLKYQINSWNQSSKTAEVWVLFDTIAAAGITECIMEHGYQVPDRSNGKLVFDTTNYFSAVYHFEGLNDKGLIIKDESAAANNGNFQNLYYNVSSGIGSSVSLGANGNQIKLQQKISVGTITEKTVSFESWVKTNIGPGAKSLFDIKVSPTLQCGFVSEAGYLKVKYKYDETGVGNFKLGDGTQQALFEASNEWARAAFSITVQSDKVAYTIYANGLKVANGFLTSLSQSFIGNLVWNDGTTILGSNFSGTYYDGQYDEVWITKTKRSDDWYKFTYENQKEKSSLVKIEDIN
jgi:hypothetical protein